MADAGALGDVAMTAVVVARARAVESARDDALFHDPLAHHFVDAVDLVGWQRGRAARLGLSPADDAAYQRRRAGIGIWVTIRTRFLDDLLLDAASDGVRQVVFVGAGLDTRAYRLDWPAGTRCFEIDVAAMITFKNGVLTDAGAQPTCERHTVACDLRDDWPGALTAAGFDARERSVWIAEGLLAYLPADANDALLSAMASLASPGSRLGVTVAGAQRAPTTARRGLWQFVPPDDAVGWLDDLGWDATVFSVVERAESYGRALPAEMTMSTARLVSATRPAPR